MTHLETRTQASSEKCMAMPYFRFSEPCMRTSTCFATHTGFYTQQTMQQPVVLPAKEDPTFALFSRLLNYTT